MPNISVSVVSHGHGDMIRSLLDDLESRCDCHDLEVFITMNVPEAMTFSSSAYSFPIRIIHNKNPKGFGENHNAAAQIATGEIFVIANPDIRIPNDPFPALGKTLDGPAVGIVSPEIIDFDGKLQDFSRERITVPRLFSRLLLRGYETRSEDVLDIYFAEWLAAIFLAVSRAVFLEIGGFDQKFYMYCEDADLCMRLCAAGYKVAVNSSIRVAHDARRQSHRNLRFLWWHFRSLMRFMNKH